MAIAAKAKKVVDTQHLAMNVKRGVVGLNDIPENLKPDVMRHLTSGEGKLIMRMRAERAVTQGDRPMTRLHQRFVAG